MVEYVHKTNTVYFEDRIDHHEVARTECATVLVGHACVSLFNNVKKIVGL